MNPIKKIDVHAHATAFPQYIPPYPNGNRFISAEELLPHYDKLNIQTGVLLPLISMESQYFVLSNENSQFLADKYSDRFLWFCCVDPRAMANDPHVNLSYLLEFFKKKGAKGMGELTAQLYADDPRIDNLFGHCAEQDLPVTIHIGPQVGGCYGIVDELGLPRIEKMLKKHPKLKILGHSQPFWSEISADNNDECRNIYPTGQVTDGRLAYLLRNYENLYCDLSAGSGSNALMRDPEYAARFIEEFSDRLLYACDFCDVSNTHSYRFNDFLEKMLADGMISNENYYKLVRGNAIKVLNLPENF